MGTGLGRLLNLGLRPLGLSLYPINAEQPSSKIETRAVEDIPQLYLDGCRVLSNRVELLRALGGNGGVAAEIGVANGDFSAQILSGYKPSALHLIDPWSHEIYAGGFDVVHARFAQEIDSGSVMVHRGTSALVLPTLAQDSFDFVYLDTTHKYDDTVQELQLCRSLIREGGRLAGHDFCVGSPESAFAYGVIPAVYEFCMVHQWAMEYVSLDANGHFSFCLKRMTPS